MNVNQALLETRLLATILTCPESGQIAVRHLGRHWRDAWTDAGRSAIARAVGELVDRGILPDSFTVESHLGDAPAAATLADLLPHAEAMELVRQRADALLQLALRRELGSVIHASQENLHSDPDLDPKAEASALTGRCAAIAAASVSDQSLAALEAKLVAEYDAARDDGVVMGLPLGHPALDTSLMGIPYGKLVVLAARPGHGKTSYACNIIDIALRLDHPVVFFSFDDDARLALRRLACIHAGVPYRQATAGRLSPEAKDRYFEALKWLGASPLQIYTNRSLSPIQCRAKLQALLCGRFRGTRPLVVVDFIQKQAHTVEDAAQLDATSRVGLASTQWKDTLEELDLPGLVLAQINRDGAGREPALENIKQCGGIEEDAYGVVLLWRAYRDDPQRPANQIQVHLAKNKCGPTARCVLHFSGYCFRYTPWRDSDQPATAEQMAAEEDSTCADMII
jgi:replicative DNA helicase